MPRRAALNRDDLVALGADRLAALVLDEAEGNPAFRKRAAAALAGAKGPAAVAAIVDRRLAALERARGYVDWAKTRAFVADLEATRAIVVDELGRADPAGALDRLVRFLAAAAAVFERVDDSSGRVQAVFHGAAEAAPALLDRLPEAGRAGLLDGLLPKLAADEYGLIETVLHEVLAHASEAHLAAADAALVRDRAQIGPRSAGPLSAGPLRDWEREARRGRLIGVRQAIADRRGDADAFIALERERTEHPDGLAVAERLLAAGRAAEALDWVRRPGRRGVRYIDFHDLADETAGSDLSDRARLALELRVLTALGRTEEAQALRWARFETSLDADFLRGYLAHLPDFEEFEVLDRAFAHAAAHAQRYRALAFFLAGPRLDLAARLVLDHRPAWEGRHYGALAPAAEALEPDHPAAASVLYRALIDDVLARARSAAYGHAARYLVRLDGLDRAALVLAGLPDAQAYRAELRRAYGRKAAFWSLVDKR